MIRKILKWIGIGLGGLVALLAVALVVLYFMGGAKIDRQYNVPVEAVAVPTDAAAVQRGEHLATILLCKRCHGDNLGGQLYFDAPGLLSIPSPNLTSGAGGVGGAYTREDWVRAIRHGVGADGRALFFMLSPAFRQFSEEDTGALIAYLKSVPPVDNKLPPRRFEPTARVMMGTGMLPPLAADQIAHGVPPPQPPAPGVTAAYGKLLGGLCSECHGAGLQGMPFGPPGQEVMTPNLTTAGELGSWSEAEFITTMRSGVTPIKRKLNDEMPWKYFGQMTDDELKALWAYLRSLPEAQQGG